MEKWKTIEPGIWKPEQKGEDITGVLVSKAPKDENTGYSARYYLDTTKGMYLVWGSAVIDDRMQYVKIGDKIRITFEGKTKNKRNQDVNLFTIEVEQNSQAENESMPLDIDQIDMDGVI
ncbi:hypothetical protein ACFL0Q_03140 [Thermodesulfobacteriota bacterium]